MFMTKWLLLVDMKANINTVLVGSKVVLVPYRSEHVPVSWLYRIYTLSRLLFFFPEIS